MPLTLDGVRNLRDVGDQPLTDGRRTREGRLFRSAALSQLTDRGLDELDTSPIGVVVDLRTPQKRDHSPNRLVRSDGRAASVTVVERPLLEGAVGGRGGAAIPTLDDIYTTMLAHAAPAFADVARLIADPPSPRRPAVLVHCSMGKDRTGVATAVLLDAVGVDREAIVADYTATEAQIAGAWADGVLATIARMGVPLTPEIVQVTTDAPAEAVRNALRWVDAHGGSAAYLASGGLDAATLDALRTALVA